MKLTPSWCNDCADQNGEWIMKLTPSWCNDCGLDFKANTERERCDACNYCRKDCVCEEEGKVTPDQNGDRIMRDERLWGWLRGPYLITTDSAEAAESGIGEFTVARGSWGAESPEVVTLAYVGRTTSLHDAYAKADHDAKKENGS